MNQENKAQRGENRKVENAKSQKVCLKYRYLYTTSKREAQGSAILIFTHDHENQIFLSI